MKKNNTAINTALNQLDAEVQKITTILVELVQDDREWWEENMLALASQPWNSLKNHLKRVQDSSLASWGIDLPHNEDVSELDPIESLVWLAGLCQLDQILIGVLPRRLVDEIGLQWRVLALHWVG